VNEGTGSVSSPGGCRPDLRSHERGDQGGQEPWAVNLLGKALDKHKANGKSVSPKMLCLEEKTP